MRRSLALVLAGGEGRRLYPLTHQRSKPAVYFGGCHRLIDFVLSNLVNSGFGRIKVLTQYRSSSLVRHLSRAWPVSSSLLDQFIEVVPAAMNLGPTWFRGTADAIWQNLDLLRDVSPDDVLVFGSDHVYKMDVGLMLAFHRQRQADLTVATIPVPRSQARAFGCVDVDSRGRVIGFVEKPDDPPGMPGDPKHTLVSMGNYVFRTQSLLGELRRNASLEVTSHDFGKDILSSAHERMSVFAYDFATQLCPGESERARGYWRDVGTIDSYFEASMDLVSVEPHLNLYNPLWPIRGVQPWAGPAKFVFADRSSGRVGMAQDSIVGPGVIISGGRLERSVLFHRVRINSFGHVSDSVLFPEVDVGRGARLRRCIVDKGVRIPPGESIGEDLEKDRKRFTVSEGGVAVVTREAFGQTDEFDV
ncbi:MAG: glucose-1-phosphate adenylyltransferase [Deltaproteobacteria bacterium]|nr:glucose-1-phosphate adenylyltransferase [Deltaproteobacteria bacterium]